MIEPMRGSREEDQSAGLDFSTMAAFPADSCVY